MKPHPQAHTREVGGKILPVVMLITIGIGLVRLVKTIAKLWPKGTVGI